MASELEQGSEVAAALAVYLEPLLDSRGSREGARVAVLGNSAGGLAAQLVSLGARSVVVYDPDPERAREQARRALRGVTVGFSGGEIDLRDAAFDLVVVPDLGAIEEPGSVVRRLRRALAPGGSVVAVARARIEGSEPSSAFAGEISEAAFEYAELYETFADQFDDVTLAGTLPFRGVVFAELGAEEPAVSVDTRLAEGDAPDVFVVVASDEPRELEPYAIVQVASGASSHDAERDAVLAAMQVRAELLTAQLDEQRARLAANEARGADAGTRLEQLVVERDAAVTRAAELEEVLVATQQALSVLEKRVLLAEQGMLERDDRLASMHAEIESRVSRDAVVVDPSLLLDVTARAERAEAALALNVADLAHVAEAHASEVAALEMQLVERARVIAALEKEIARREHLVRELVTALEEARESNGVTAFEAAPPVSQQDPEEVMRLRRKLDEMATEIARREAELVARGWKIAELEAGRGGNASEELARVQGELDALRQALTQEHAARVAAESRAKSQSSGVDTP